MSVINRYFYPVAAGIETNLIEILPLLVKKGWDVSVHVTSNTLEKRNHLKSRQRIKGIKIFRYTSGIFGFYPKIVWGKTNIITIENFTLSPHLLILSSIYLRKIAGRKDFAVIFSPHGGFTPPWHMYPITQRLPKYLIHRTIGKFLINSVVDGIRAVSDSERDDLISEGLAKEKIRVIGNGIEKEAFYDLEKIASKTVKKDVESFGRYMVQIARIHRIKNIHTTIKALPYLPKNVKFVVLGQVEDKIYMNELRKLVKDLHLENRVIFYGVVRGVDKYFIIKNSACMVHMSVWEAYANVVNESMSQGKICVVSNISSMKRLVKHGVNGYRVATYDHKQLGETLTTVFKKKNNLAILKMGRRNHVLAKNRTWENIAKEVETLYAASADEYNEINAAERVRRYSFAQSLLRFHLAFHTSTRLLGHHGQYVIHVLH